MNKIEITVVGPSNCGKSTIAHVLREALQRAGLHSVVVVDLDTPTHFDAPLRGLSHLDADVTIRVRNAACVRAASEAPEIADVLAITANM